MLNPGHIWRRKHESVPSPVVPALNRVREMREHADWPSLSSTESIQQRAERVADTREHIKIPALGTDRDTRPRPERRLWLRDLLRPLFYGGVVLWAIVLAGYLLPEPPKEVAPTASTAVFQLRESYPGLTESLAERFARRGLAGTGFDQSDWLPTQFDVTDHGATIFFRNKYDQRSVMRVTVQLDAGGKRITCTVDYQ